MLDKIGALGGGMAHVTGPYVARTYASQSARAPAVFAGSQCTFELLVFGESFRRNQLVSFEPPMHKIT